VKRPAAALALGLALAAAACGGSGRATGPGLDVSGTFEGTLAISLPQSATVTVRFTLTQTSTLVNGTYSTGTGDFGTVSGTAVDTSFAARSLSTPFGFACGFQGSIAEDARSIAGAFDCSDGRAGIFTLTRP
jgi:hypothetical protein